MSTSKENLELVNNVKQEEIDDAVYELAETIEMEDGGEYLAISVENAQYLINQQVIQALTRAKEEVIGSVPSKMNTDNWKYDRRVAELKTRQHQQLDNLIKEYKGDKG